MTSHEVAYFRYLLRTIKDLYIEKEAMSVVLDTARNSGGLKAPEPWREAVQRMRNDPVYCSAVEANFAPYFHRLELALLDQDLLKKLRGIREGGPSC